MMKNILLVIFLLAAGTVFSQNTTDGQNPGETPLSSETKTAPDAENAAEEINPPSVPAKAAKKTAEQTPEGPPQWAKDLRRGEIIAFGSLPFTFFFTQTFMDLYRTATHGWDGRYAPGPFKSAGAIPMTDTELKIMFGITVSASVLVAVVDHFIVKHKRAKARTASLQ